MSLELVNTVATLTTTLVIAATAVAALAQLRHLRAGNQIAGFLTLRNMLDDDAHQHALKVLQREGDISTDPAFREYLRSVFSNRPVAPDERLAEVRAAVVLIANAYEVMGTLVRHQVVDQRLFLEQYSSTIITAWQRLEPYIALTRQVQSDDGIWEDFEYVAAISQAYLAQYPSVYPKTTRRLLPPQARPGQGV